MLFECEVMISIFGVKKPFRVTTEEVNLWVMLHYSDVFQLTTEIKATVLAFFSAD